MAEFIIILTKVTDNQFDRKLKICSNKEDVQNVQNVLIMLIVGFIKIIF